jgi:hypothetical protein
LKVSAMSDREREKGLTRRDFIKTLGLCGAAATAIDVAGPVAVCAQG